MVPRERGLKIWLSFASGRLSSEVAGKISRSLNFGVADVERVAVLERGSALSSSKNLGGVKLCGKKCGGMTSFYSPAMAMTSQLLRPYRAPLRPHAITCDSWLPLVTVGFSNKRDGRCSYFP